jgi:RimJ/RimL family protein N-acetyltransferase
MRFIQPVTLTGRFVRLEPLRLEHLEGLCQVGLEPSIWEHMLYGKVESPLKMQAFIEDLLERQARGSDLPFTVIHLGDQRPAGCTRYLNIDPEIPALEIGGTWYGLAYQRTVVNTECKFLLLRHAFETLGVRRVQFKTDVNNKRSQIALERIGAQREGILRKHMLRPDGSLRSSVYYSLLPEEWPSVKARLQAMLEGT